MQRGFHHGLLTLLLFCAACGSSPDASPATDTAPRSLDAIDDAGRRLVFDAIIECENEGLRVAAAAFPPLRPGDPDYDAPTESENEPKRFMRQHEVEAGCKAALAHGERLSEQQLVFLRTYGMQQRWFIAHADEGLVPRVPLGEPIAPR